MPNDYSEYADLTVRRVYCEELITNSNVGFDGNIFVGSPTVSSNFSDDIELNITSNTYNSDAWKMLDTWLRTNLIDTPPAPTLISTSTDKSKITISWSNPIQVEAGFSNIKVPRIDEIYFQKKLSGTNTWDTPVGFGSTVVTSLELYVENNGSSGIYNQTTYRYYTITSETNYDVRIFSKNQNDTFDLKYLVLNDLSTDSIGPPSAPTSISSSTINDSSLSLNWQSPEDHDTSTSENETTPAILNYQLSYTPSTTVRYGGLYDTNTQNTTTTNTNKTISSLYTGTEYYITVEAKNTQNTSYGPNISHTSTTSYPSKGNYLSTSFNFDSLSPFTARKQDGTVVYNVINNATSVSSTSQNILTNDTVSTTQQNTSNISTFYKINDAHIDTISHNINGFSHGNENSTYNGSDVALQISNDSDKYSGHRSGFWKSCDVKMHALTINPSHDKYSMYTTQDTLNNQYTSNQLDFYIDNMNVAPSISNLCVVDTTGISYVSGVPTYNNNSSFTSQLNVSDLCNWFIRYDEKHVAIGMYSQNTLIGNSVSITRTSANYYTSSSSYSTSSTLHNNTGTELTINADDVQFNNISLNISSASNLYNEDILVKATPYNIYTTGSQQSSKFVNSTGVVKKLRVDTKSLSVLNQINDSTNTTGGLQVKCGDGLYPTSFGQAYINSDTIIGTSELQLINGRFSTPKYINSSDGYFDYSSDYHFPVNVNGPDYSSVKSNSSDYRYVLFKFTNVITNGTYNKLRITLNDFSNMTIDLQNNTSNHIMQLKIDGTSSFNTAWLDLTSAVSGLGVNTNNASTNGTTTLASSTNGRRDCYIISGTSSTENPIIYIRIGLRNNVSSYIKNVSVQAVSSF